MTLKTPPFKMTKEQGMAFKENWKAVNEFEKEELRRTPIERKFKQLIYLMRSAETCGWRQKLKEEAEGARENWIKLKQAYESRRVLS